MKIDKEYVEEMQDLLWDAYGVLIDMPFGNPHRKEVIIIALKIVDLLEDQPSNKAVKSDAEQCGPDCHFTEKYGFVHEADCPNG